MFHFSSVVENCKTKDNKTLRIQTLVSDFGVDSAGVENRDDLDQAQEWNDPASCPARNYFRYVKYILMEKQNT